MWDDHRGQEISKKPWGQGFQERELNKWYTVLKGNNNKRRV